VVFSPHGHANLTHLLDDRPSRVLPGCLGREVRSCLRGEPALYPVVASAAAGGQQEAGGSRRAVHLHHSEYVRNTSHLIVGAPLPAGLDPAEAVSLVLSHVTASKSEHELVVGLGATPIDYRSEDFSERIRELTADGVDAAFDPIGGENSKRSFKSLKRGGTLAAYGFSDNAMGKGGSVPLEFMLIRLWDIVPNGRTTTFYIIGPPRPQRNTNSKQCRERT